MTYVTICEDSPKSTPKCSCERDVVTELNSCQNDVSRIVEYLKAEGVCLIKRDSNRSKYKLYWCYAPRTEVNDIVLREGLKGIKNSLKSIVAEVTAYYEDKLPTEEEERSPDDINKEILSVYRRTITHLFAQSEEVNPSDPTSNEIVCLIGVAITPDLFKAPATDTEASGAVGDNICNVNKIPENITSIQAILRKNYPNVADSLEEQEKSIAGEDTKLAFKAQKDSLMISVLNDIARGKYIKCKESLPLISWGGVGRVVLNPALLNDFRPTPTFDRFIGNIKDPDSRSIVMAFVWKIFNPLDGGRQALFGVSGGKAGQSSFWRCMECVLQGVTGSMASAGEEDAHASQSVYKKRLIIHPEMDNERLLEGAGLARKITGGDAITVNQKFKAHIRHFLKCRLTAFGQTLPKVDGTSTAELTRSLVYELESLKEEDVTDGVASIDAKYASEVWSFLRKCRNADFHICDGVTSPPDMSKQIGANKDDIPWSDGMTRLFNNSCLSVENTAVLGFLATRVRLKKDFFTSQKSFMSALKSFVKDQQGLEMNLSDPSRKGQKEKTRLLDMIKRCLEPVKCCGVYYGEDPATRAKTKGFIGIELCDAVSEEERIPELKIRFGVFRGYSDFTKYDYPDERPKAITYEELDI